MWKTQDKNKKASLHLNRCLVYFVERCVEVLLNIWSKHCLPVNNINRSLRYSDLHYVPSRGTLDKHGRRNPSKSSKQEKNACLKKYFFPKYLERRRYPRKLFCALLLLVRPLLLATARVIINVPFSRLTFSLTLHSFSFVFTFLIIQAIFTEKVRKNILCT